MAFPFQSVFKRNKKLNGCAVHDPDHISERDSPRGPHVLFIKQALNAWSAKQKPPFPPLANDEFFDAATGTRVELYKASHDPPIINFAGKIDRIVGKKTVKFLDDELPPDIVPDLPDVPVPTKTFVDVVVQFVGGVDTGVVLDGSVLSRGNLTNYNTRTRTLVKIGRGSRHIRTDQPARNLIVEVMGKIRTQMNLPGIERGIICVYGSSAGGRNAIELATVLERENFPLVYVGVEDAAFFPDETNTVPDLPFIAGKVRNIPIFDKAGLPKLEKTRTKINFFQTFGNHAKQRKIGGPFRDLIWTSGMDGQEIHGDIDGFTRQIINVDPTGGASNVFNRFDSPAHNAAVGLATPQNESNIAGLLVKQTPFPPPR